MENELLDWVFTWIDSAYKEIRKAHDTDAEEERMIVDRVNRTFADLRDSDKQTAFLYLLGKIVREED